MLVVDLSWPAGQWPSAGGNRCRGSWRYGIRRLFSCLCFLIHWSLRSWSSWSSVPQEERRGKKVSLLLEEIDKLKAERVTEMAILLVSQASSCISSENKHKLPSAAQVSVWSSFHQCRGSPKIKQVWGCLCPMTLLSNTDRSLNLHCSFSLIRFWRSCFTTEQLQWNKALQAHKMIFVIAGVPFNGSYWAGS